jgi:hypothetical protein
VWSRNFKNEEAMTCVGVEAPQKREREREKKKKKKGKR